MVTHSKSNTIKILSQQWPILLSVISFFCYIIGYLKGLFFLRAIGVFTSPTEVYAMSSIFVSGITLVAACIFIPTMTILISYISTNVLMGRSFKNPAFTIGIATLVSWCVIKVIDLIYNSMYYFLPGFTIFPGGNLSYCIIGLMIITNAIGLKFSNLRKKMFALSLLGGIIWGVGIFHSYISCVEAIKREWFAWGTAEYVQYGFQESYISGSIITKHPISEDSDTSKLLQKFSNPSDKCFFRTRGTLLSVHDNKYYFTPYHLVDTLRNNASLCIIPENNIVTFIHRKDYDIYKDKPDMKSPYWYSVVSILIIIIFFSLFSYFIQYRILVYQKGKVLCTKLRNIFTKRNC